MADLADGFEAVLGDRRLVSVLAVLAAAIGVLGALNVFIVVIAIDILGLDESAAGYLTAVSGIGALLGSGASVALVGRERLGLPLLAGAAVFGVAVAALGPTTR